MWEDTEILRVQDYHIFFKITHFVESTLQEKLLQVKPFGGISNPSLH